MTTKTEKNQSTITPEFIEVLRAEGNKAWSVCLALNSDKKYQQTVQSITDEVFQGVAYKAQHLLMRDLVKIYNTFALLHNKTSAVPEKVKFILIFLYEKLQGKDLATSFDAAKLRQLPLSKKFDKNVALLQETSFFQPLETLKSEYASTLALSKMKSTEFQQMASFLNRMALLMAKSDGVISAEEDETLKGISEKINNPKLAFGPSDHNEVPEDDTLEKVMAELNELIGLDNIKKNVQDLTNFLKVLSN